MKSTSTIPTGTSFAQWAQQLNKQRGTDLKPEILASQLGLSLSKDELNQAMQHDLVVDLAGVAAPTGDDVQAFAGLQAKKGVEKQNSAFSVQSAQRANSSRSSAGR